MPEPFADQPFNALPGIVVFIQFGAAAANFAVIKPEIGIQL